MRRCIDITDTTGLLGTGVDALRFSFFQGDAGDNAMREIDVFGAATTIPAPEPASFMMLGLGLLGLACVRRCRREL